MLAIEARHAVASGRAHDVPSSSTPFMMPTSMHQPTDAIAHEAIDDASGSLLTRNKSDAVSIPATLLA